MRTRKQKYIAFIVTILTLAILFVISVRTGSLKLSLLDLYRGLFIEFNPDVATVYDLRFPRILIAMLAGAAVGVSGCLLQAVMRNPLADPGIIGISSGASFISVVIIGLLPQLYFYVPLFAFAGGFLAFGLVYSLSYSEGLSPVRIILVGVAVNAMFTGLMEGFYSATGAKLTGVASIINANISMKTWADFRLLLVYVAIGLVLSLVVIPKCNLLGLDDKTVRSLGVDVDKIRLHVSIVGVLLASISTAVIGPISFLGLIAPHIARIFVGSDHKYLIPYTAVLGACLLLLADTLGRVVVSPYEISATVVMSIVGGPFFVGLLRHAGARYAR